MVCMRRIRRSYLRRSAVENAERLSRLKDIDWTVGVIQQWAVNPSEYTEAHQKSILLTINVVRTKITKLLEDESKDKLKS
jgi:hypothetical protein